MAPVQRVEVTRLVRRVHRHPGKARLLEIEHAGARQLRGDAHRFTSRMTPACSRARR